MNNIYVYILIMWGVTYLIRSLPLTLFKKQINNEFIRSFLYYVPYVTLAVMTFPAILHATRSPISGAAALIAGIIVAWWSEDLFKTAVSCCLVVLLLETFLF